MADGPLRDIRILDLTRVWAGPLATRILSDLGAEIVKIEANTSRGPRGPWPTPMGGFIGDGKSDDPWNKNAIFVKLARNSKSVSIDLKSETGRKTFLELVSVADIVMENFSARAMPELGLDYDVLKKANPKIIYLTMPGFGTYGPYRDRVAFGPIIEPMTGLTAVMGYSKDEPRNPATALVDPISALSATTAVVTALRQRTRTGKSVYAEMSLLESGVTFNGHWLIEQQLGADIEPIGNRHPQMAPHGIYPCEGDDQWVAIACENDDCWRRITELIDDGLDPSSSLSDRIEAQGSIDKVISVWTSKRTKYDAANELQAVGISAGPVNTTPDMTSDDQIKHRGYFVPLEEGTPVPGNPLKMSGCSSADWTPCPGLGANNSQVLKDWLAYTDERINTLTESGVLADMPPL